MLYLNTEVINRYAIVAEAEGVSFRTWRSLKEDAESYMERGTPPRGPALWHNAAGWVPIER